MTNLSTSSTRSRSTIGQWFGVSLGIAFVTIEIGETALTKADAISQRVFASLMQVAEPLRAPLDKLGMTELLTQQINAISTQVNTAVQGLETRGRNGGVESAKVTNRAVTDMVDRILRQLRDDSELLSLVLAQLDWILPKLGEVQAVKDLVRNQVAAILPELADDAAVSELIRAQLAAILPTMANDAAVQQLIRAQVSSYLTYLNEHPDEVQTLIRTQGDVYIDYLNAHPAQVQTLLQGQSLGLASQVRDEIRERTVTADGLVDTVVRNLLRLKPREELSPPPIEVQRRAQSAHLPGDDQEEPHNGHI